VGSGKTAAAFTAKLLRFDHARMVAISHNAHLFHLYAKTLYERLGIPDSRNRRPRAPFAVKAKLMGLDYVLAHPDCAFFATYHERMTFLTDVLGIDRERLPRKFYGPEGNRRPRYFVDGLPLGLSTDVDGRPLVTFCYVDDGGSSVCAFQTYLGQYRSLLRSLTTPARIVFISGCRRHFHAARIVFDHFIDWQPDDDIAGRGDLVARVIPYFRVRALYESRQFDQLTKEAMDRLRDGRDAFRGATFDAWFEQWRVEGDAALKTASEDIPRADAFKTIIFETWCADQVYDLFGTVWAAS
jgi:hypothetical protein